MLLDERSTDSRESCDSGRVLRRPAVVRPCRPAAVAGLEGASMDPAIRDKPLELRKVEIDFSNAKIHGNPAAPEYSHILNGVSALLPDLEAFLNKVVRSVAQQLPEDAVELR